MGTKKIFIKGSLLRSNVEYYSDTSIFSIIPAKRDVIIWKGKNLVVQSRSFDIDGNITLHY